MEAGRVGWVGGALSLAAIFLQSVLLVVGVLPFWQRIAGVPRMRAVLGGINAAVVGLLLAALCGPLRAEAVRGIADLIVVIVGVVALVRWRVPTAWLVLAAPLAGMLALALRWARPVPGPVRQCMRRSRPDSRVIGNDAEESPGSTGHGAR